MMTGGINKKTLNDFVRKGSSNFVFRTSNLG